MNSELRITVFTHLWDTVNKIYSRMEDIDISLSIDKDEY